MSERNITLYYIGGDGRENRPHRILYGQKKFVVTPPLGEAFAQKFTAREVKEIMGATGFTYGDQIIYPVTEHKAVADARKKGRSIEDVLKNVDRIVLTEADLLAEVSSRPEVLEKLKALLQSNEPAQTEEAPKKTAKKEKVEVEANA